MTSRPLERTFDVPAHVVTRELDGELVLLNLETGLYFGLDGVGAMIWERIEKGEPLSDARAAILSDYDATPEQVEADMLDLVARLEEAALIEADS